LLGIPVDDRTLGLWRTWLAPQVQPFFVERSRDWPTVAGDHELTAELRDTYELWNVDRALAVTWLDEAGFAALPRSQRARLVRSQVRHSRGAVPTVRGWSDLVGDDVLREQADGHRFVWWPSLLGQRERVRDILERVVAKGNLRSRHAEVTEETWRGCAGVLPRARELAGTFPAGSGPNCFGTVLAAAGVEGAAEEWLVREPFEAWLAATCRHSAASRGVGTVLVWRDGDGQAVHAAVEIGDGWVLEKPSQTWCSPRTIASLRDVVSVNRARGQRLERHRIVV
jgi:hypothetical protein